MRRRADRQARHRAKATARSRRCSSSCGSGSSRSSSSKPTSGSARRPRSCATLNEAQAQADMQTSLTNARVQGPDRRKPRRGRPGRAPASRPSRRSSWPRPSWPARAAQAEQTVVLAEADSQRADARRPRRKPADHAGRSVRGGRAAAEDQLATATRGCTPCRRSAASWRTARSRWCPSGCSWPAATAGTTRQQRQRRWPRRQLARLATTGLVGLLLQTLLAERTTLRPSRAERRPGPAQGADQPPDARDDGEHDAG